MDLSIDDIVIHADSDLWIPVPLDFPFDDWATPSTWGAEIASVLSGDVGMPAAVVAELAGLATEVASTPPPNEDALAKFWYFPRTGGGMQIAHLYATYRSAVGDDALATLALGGESVLLPQRVEAIDVPGMDQAVRVLAVGRLSDADPGLGTMTVARIIGETSGVIVMLEVLDTGVDLIAQMLPYLEALLGAVSFESAT